VHNKQLKVAEPVEWEVWLEELDETVLGVEDRFSVEVSSESGGPNDLPAAPAERSGPGPTVTAPEGGSRSAPIAIVICHSLLQPFCLIIFLINSVLFSNIIHKIINI
jgi:hypothetical protein